MAVVHVRSGGWCDLCGGIGLAKVAHVDVDLSLEARQVLSVAASRIAQEARARLAELAAAAGGGCEAAGERRFEEGRLQVVEQDLWQAVGLTALPDPVEVGDAP